MFSQEGHFIWFEGEVLRDFEVIEIGEDNDDDGGGDEMVRDGGRERERERREWVVEGERFCG